MIEIDYSRDASLSPQAKLLLKEYYLKEGESPQDGFARAALAYCYGDYNLAQRVYEYASKGWFMFASPVLANAPKYMEKPKGLPISCFLNYVDDTLEGLIDHTAETRWMSVKGGGVGGHWSNVRAVSKKAPGPIPFLKTIDADMTAYHQGETRRGSYAAYMNVDHPDIEEFISMRVPTGGDINRKCLNLHNAVNITDKFLEAVKGGEDWNLICPNSGEVRDTLKARDLWSKIIKTRFKTGEPYINYIDEANRKLPKDLKEKGLTIKGSNLCNEIHLPTSKNRSAVCCLSSLNLELYDEWVDTNIVEDLIEFLDNVLQFFIDHAPDSLAKAKYSAERERSIGLGTMGFHYLLQRKGLPFGSDQAKELNKEVFRNIKVKASMKSYALAKDKGGYLDGEGLSRCAHLLAIAPNANNSTILNTSASIEPVSANAYVHKSRIGSHLIKNRYLEKLLKEKGHDNKRIWDNIISNSGSVQHLDDILSEKERAVFLTSDEIDQRDVVDQARIRQSYICQGQSVNLFFKPKSAPKYVNEVHLRAFDQEGEGSPLKGLYYLRTEAEHRADKLTDKKERKALEDNKVCNINDKECTACQG